MRISMLILAELHMNFAIRKHAPTVHASGYVFLTDLQQSLDGLFEQ